MHFASCSPPDCDSSTQKSPIWPKLVKFFFFFFCLAVSDFLCIGVKWCHTYPLLC